MSGRPTYGKDDGCEYSPTCISCTRSVCKHDDNPAWNPGATLTLRELDAPLRYRQRVPWPEIARVKE